MAHRISNFWNKPPAKSIVKRPG